MPDDSKGSMPEDTPEAVRGHDSAANSVDEPGGEASDDSTEGAAGEQFGEPVSPRAVRTMRDVNKLVPGVLTVHYIQRDVSLAVDGDAAIRAIATWHDQHEGFTDPLHPVSSSAISGWVGIDLEYVMGLTWMPTLGAGEIQRVTIDPRP